MKYVIIALLSLCVSCATLKKENTRRAVNGTYYKQFKDGLNYTLTINSDSTFEYRIKGGHIPHSGSQCKGKWTQSEDTIYLKCFDEDFPSPIASGYMVERERKAILLKSDKIKMDNITLRLIDRL
ncbi:hypothetical protein [Taibaiella helva]|uniref:hypothetical protein n=1 Tax=Taibaiella helva TaxID=2301235 RepID=UPI000E594523|nr:hypothetical protein [Taibaiella helva]